MVREIDEACQSLMNHPNMFQMSWPRHLFSCSVTSVLKAVSLAFLERALRIFRSLWIGAAASIYSNSAEI